MSGSRLTVMYLAVFVGGAVGSLLRELVIPYMPVAGPFTSTLLVNAVACLLLGWLHTARHRVHAHVTHLGAIGFCGGLSTFSSFVADVAGLADTASPVTAALAPALEIAAGLLAAIIGLAVGRAVHGDPPR